MFFGKVFIVDVENWMVYKGIVNVILNIFRYYKMFFDFIILFGDVYYFFVYDVCLCFRCNSFYIIQFICSGLKNIFLDGLIKWLDRLNCVFYCFKLFLNFFIRC